MRRFLYLSEYFLKIEKDTLGRECWVSEDSDYIVNKKTTTLIGWNNGTYLRREQLERVALDM